MLLRSPLFWQLAGSQAGLVVLTATLSEAAGPAAPVVVVVLLAAAVVNASWLTRRIQTAREPAAPLHAGGQPPPAAVPATAPPAADGAAADPNRRRPDYLAVLSHEMRTPLNGIMGMTQLALQTPLTAEQREYLDVVQNSSDFLLGVINDLADPTRLETGAVELQAVHFGLRAVLGETLKLVALRAHQKGLELIGTVASAAPETLEGDPYRLRQLLLNLLGNAIHFTERGEIVVTVTPTSAGDAPGVCELHFRVTDSGVGIAPERQARLFDDWSPATAGGAIAGRGLGLVMARGLVERMGGRIGVESAPGVGSTFHFTVPFALPAGRANEAPAVPAGLAGRVVLVVDDNAACRNLLGEWLTTWGLRPLLAESAEAAAAAGGAAAAELALVDASLGASDGFACAETLRRGLGASQLPVVMLLAAHLPAQAARCRELQLAEPLIKPVGQTDLLAALTRSLGGVRQAADRMPRLAPPAPNRLRVLLAESNPLQRQLAVVLLEKLGHQVVVAATGQEVLKALAERPADVILLDPHLTDADGFATAAAIRAAEKDTNRHVPIIALVGYGRTDERTQCRAAGMDLHVSKPMHVQELVRAIESLVNPGESRR